jgi:hypothetical protein
MAGKGVTVHHRALAIEPDWADVPAPERGWRRAEVLVPCCFVLAAAGVMALIWASPTTRVPTNVNRYQADLYLGTWFLRYAATAVAHGHLPALITTSVNAPQGINMMWNTSMLLPGVLLTPVTLLAGPTASLTVLLTLGFAGSASAMYLVLRRWGASIGAAVVGGALYGFSPALMMAAEDHYHLQFAVLPPLIIDAALRLVTGRGRPYPTGAWLGLLLAAQLFIAEELLVDTALAGLLILVVLVASRPSAMRTERLRQIAGGAAIAVAVTLLICGRALWVQFHGPLKESGSPWQLVLGGLHPADLVTAPDTQLLHGNFGSFLAASQQLPMETLSYLGWPLLVAVAAALIVFWRDMRIRAAGLTFVLLEWLGLGNLRFSIGSWRAPYALLPWHWLLHVPVLSQVMPNRFPILADGAAAVVLAFAIDRARAAVPVRPAWRLAVAAVTAAVLIPVIPGLVPAISPIPVPTGWQAALAGLHLRPGAPILVLPGVPNLAGHADAMEWQAETGAQVSLVNGYCIAPNPNGRAGPCGLFRALSYPERTAMDELFGIASGTAHASGPLRAMLAVAILAWRPTAIVATAGSHAALARYLIYVLGPPAIRRGSVLGWRIAPLRGLLMSYASCANTRQYLWSGCHARVPTTG